MRQLAQIEYLKENSNLVLISVDASAEIRFDRAKKRNGIGEAKNLDDFVKKEIEENSGDNIQRLFECMRISDYNMENNSAKRYLYKQIDGILKREYFI